MWSTSHGLQTVHMMEARNTTACCSRSFLPISVFSQMLQVNMEDSGRTLATPSNPTINDEKCGRGYCSICEVAAPVRRVTVRGLCQLSIFDRSIDNVKLLSICTSGSPLYFSFLLQGLQLHHQCQRAANVCRQPHLCSLLQQIHQLLGVVRPILDLHNITCSVGAILNKHALI